MSALIDRTGKRYGRLVAIGLSAKTKIGRKFWNCRCDCGNEVIVDGCNLSGNTQSCGCYHNEMVAKAIYKHGGFGTGAYSSWQSMKARCCCPTNNKYQNYGGRGIKVCDRWIDSFENFLSDMGVRPHGRTLDRVDNNGNYEPSNCKWGTPKEQGNNKRSNVFLEYKGQRLTASQWSEKTGLGLKLILGRVGYGWTADRILETPRKHVTRL